MTGWTLLDRLKHDVQTAHIPVHIISGHENSRRGFMLGACSCIPKDVTQESLKDVFSAVEVSMATGKKNLLLIAENDVRRVDIRTLLAGTDLDIVDCEDLAEAKKVLASRDVDGIVLDWVPEAASIEFIESVQSRSGARVPPIIVSGSRPLSEHQINEIHQRARSGPVRYAPSIERLLDETVLLLHRDVSELSEQQQQTLAEVRQIDPVLAGRKVLVIDDDVRNIFALASVLDHRGMRTIHAENGRAGVELLRATGDVDIVLMDIMMPGMDGYETMREIRKAREFLTLPIVALTAKAMKGDREKCLRAGASDYVTKPVDLDLLFSTMRVWMAREVDLRFEHGTAPLPTWLDEHEISLDDDRNQIQPGDRVVLIVEDDPTFAELLVDAAHERGWKALTALRGSAAINLARSAKPNAVTLDVRLPDMSGWTVLDHLRHDPMTRHIPVHVITSSDSPRDGFIFGAMTCTSKEPEAIAQLFSGLEKSIERRKKKLLVISGSEAMRKEIADYVQSPDIDLTFTSSGAEALAILRDDADVPEVDGIVLDWVISSTQDVDFGVGFIEEVQARFHPFVPAVVILGPPQLETRIAHQLHLLSRASSVRYAPSMLRLLDETVLLMHRSEEDLTETQRRDLTKARQVDPSLAGRKILVVDDDLRNIFALSSIFEQHEITVLHAETGKRGIERLQENPDVDLVLVDIMMPEMDGYETTRAIRRLPGFASLPVIALTAKAMKGDREKCLQAGASDYVSKPVDLAYLFSVMRVWLASAQNHRDSATAAPNL